MKKLVFSVLSGMLLSSVVPMATNASDAVRMKQAQQAGIPTSAAGLEIVRRGLIAEYKQVQTLGISPEAYVGYKNQGKTVAQMIELARPTAQAQPAAPAPSAPIQPAPAVPGISAEDAKKMDDEIKALKRQLAAALAAGGSIPAQSITTDQKQVSEDTKNFIAQLEQTPARIGEPGFVGEAKDLLMKIEETQNVEAVLAFYNEIIKRYTELPKDAPAQVQKNLGVLAEELDKNNYVAKVIAQKAKADENAKIAKMARVGDADLTAVIAKIQAEPAYIKTSPLTVLLFLTRTQLAYQVVLAELAKLSSFVKQTPPEDLRAIYTHFYNQKIMPNDPMAKITTTLMKTIGQAIESNQSATGLQAGVFEKRFGIGSPERGALVALINNIPDAGIKNQFTQDISIGAPAPSAPPAVPAAPTAPVPPLAKPAAPVPPLAKPAAPTTTSKPPVAFALTASELLRAGMEGTVTAVIGESVRVKLTNVPEFPNTVVLVDANAKISGNKPLQKNNKIKFSQLRKKGLAWTIEGDIEVLER